MLKHFPNGFPSTNKTGKVWVIIDHKNLKKKRKRIAKAKLFPNKAHMDLDMDYLFSLSYSISMTGATNCKWHNKSTLAKLGGECL